MMMNNSILNSKAELSSISCATDLIDAKLEQHQLSGSNHLCPGCGYNLEPSKPDWVGLPAGVKFDPTDQELIEHLEAKVEASKSPKSHPLIDEFIPTIRGEDGICYTHPEKLPGVTRDGLSRHFFHRPSKAYTTGTRKRRKIQTELCDNNINNSNSNNLQQTASGGGGETRWHKTGKTRPVMVNGKQKGCKKILVLYTNFGKNRKPEKTNWVMHQYHLGQLEEEKEGELVVSKIFYQTQPRQCNWSADRITTTTTTKEGSNSNNSELSGKKECTNTTSSIISKDHQPQVINMHEIDQHQHRHYQLGGISSYATSHVMDLQHLKPDELSNFASFQKNFHEVGIVGGDASTTRRDQMVAMSSSTSCDDQHQHNPHHHHVMTQQTQEYSQHPHHHHQVTAGLFHVSSQIMSSSLPPPQPPLQNASIILDDDSFQHVSRIMLPNHNFQEPSITNNNQPEADQWLKYSSFWPDPDNSDHHHHG